MASSTQPTLIAKSDKELHIHPGMANRHGLITGATGTGKTVSLQVLAESFSLQGIPCFMTDIKGDLSGVARAGSLNAKISERVLKMGLEGYENRAFSVVFFDVFGEQGHPMRTTISEMGPLLISRLLNLNDTQSGILNIVFRIADENGMLLLDLKDLNAMLGYVGNNRKEFTTSHGHISAASIGAIKRNLMILEDQGIGQFFGETAFDVHDLLKTDAEGMGVLNILAADRLMHSPRVYSTFLLWLLSELYDQLPEETHIEQPKLVFFFDEAHMLFTDAPRVLQEKVEQVIRLIRSKGVGVYFVTQNPLDVPDSVLSQLGNRIQHALRAYTPREQKAVKAAATTFRQNPAFDTEAVIKELGVGEGLVSFLDGKGVPAMVERAMVCPPCAQIGPISKEERNDIISNSTLYGVYEPVIDRESAYEILKAKVEKTREASEAMERQAAEQKARKAKVTAKKTKKAPPVIRETGRAITRGIGYNIGRQIVRGILGTLFGSSR
ncbi:MAG: DUF853 family protein [Bacteroidales bacterium]|jgi:DNA helicase HerA-like ATPase|nr:DUF853 family protein [Bacteroidales bacterium]